MNNKIINTSLLIALTLVGVWFSQPIYAISDQGNSAKNNTETVVQTKKEKREETKATGVQERLEYWTQKRQATVQAICNRQKTRFENRLAKLLGIKQRIQERINQGTQEGKDMSKALAILAEFETHKALYTTHSQQMQEEVTQLLAAEKPQAWIPALRQTAQDVAHDLHEMKRLLVQTIPLLD